jgi:rare lipoprotein A (peptidoglycan hydrolase)
LPRTAFTWLPTPGPAQPTPHVGLRAAPVVDSLPKPTARVLTQPKVAQDADSIVKATPRDVSPLQRGVTSARPAGSGVRGQASWYCSSTSACHKDYPGGLYAAAGPALRVGDWRGRTVTVCGNGNCVNVKLIDWCGCSSSRVIDLYSDAFKRLAPLSAGVLRVTVSW